MRSAAVVIFLFCLVFARPVYAGQAADKDVPYQNGGGGFSSMNGLDIYRDPSNGRGRPVMLYVHGGGWQIGDKGRVGSQPEAFLARGFVYVSANYRLYPEAGWREQASDIASAVAWIRDHIHEYGGDYRKLYLMGHSAGAHLVSLVAIDNRYLARFGLSTSDLSGVVGLDTATYDMTEKMAFIRARDGGKDRIFSPVFGDDPEEWQKASPVHYISGNNHVPPFVLTYAGRRADTRKASNDFALALKEKGVRAGVVEVPSANHAMVRRNFGTSGDPQFQAVCDFFGW